MKVTIAAVISADGKLTRHQESDVHAWASTEDHDHFVQLVEAHDAIVVGSTTYGLMKDKLDLKPSKLRAVLTSHPQDFSEDVVEGQLEFFNLNPKELIDLLESRGHKKLLVAGGSQMMADFLSAKLVDKLYLTLEPHIFGTGNPLVASQELNVNLQLLDYRQLNDKGSLLLRYKIG